MEKHGSFIPAIFLMALFTLLATLFATAFSHGSMLSPRPRGLLSGRSFYISSPIDPTAPTDQKPHFPAGDKSSEPGSGFRSQVAAAGRDGWTPFTPLDRNFRWRAGVCGDLKSGEQDHLKDGVYYHGGHIVATYESGDVVDVVMKLSAHHNGFIELHVCDVSKCPGGDISEECFQQGHCQALQRTSNGACDRGRSEDCAPIDRNYPGRWYLPCSKFPGDNFSQQTFGPHVIQYNLPARLTCEHCVLQWFWTAANTCNPPGVLEYFRGADRPLEWGSCPGQGGARGGAAWGQQPCDEERFPEEYLQCADIQIRPSSRRAGTSPSPTPRGRRRPTPTPRPRRSATPGPTLPRSPSGSGRVNPRRPFGRYNVTQARSEGFGDIRDIVLIGDDRRIVSLREESRVDVSRYRTVTIEAITRRGVRLVGFYVNGRLLSTDRAPRFYIAGKRNRRNPRPWTDAIYNRWFTVGAKSGVDIDAARVYLEKN